MPETKRNVFREDRYKVLARKAPASGGIPPGLISCKHLSVLHGLRVKDELCLPCIHGLA